MEQTKGLKAKTGVTLIAEIGVNYYDIATVRQLTPLAAAKLMIAEAAAAGVHAVKFQSYKAETLAARSSPAYWDLSEEPTPSQYELFRKFDAFGAEEYTELADYCRTLGVVFLSTAFDTAAADYLEPLMPAYKISSSDLTNLPFLRYQAQKGKPILLSTGAATLAEIERAVETLRAVNKEPLVLLHCVLEYPTPYADANLQRISALRQRFAGADITIGYSDHTKPDACYDVIKTAYLMGARVIEKHFTLDKTLRGNDHYHAMDPQDVRSILEGLRFLDAILGDGALDAKACEAAARQNARRSLVAVRAIPRGTVLTEQDLTAKRPASGISPTEYEAVLGRRAATDIAADTILQWELLEAE